MNTDEHNGRLATLQAGKWADFVALDKNPLEDIRNTKTTRSVWKQPGAAVNRHARR